MDAKKKKSLISCVGASMILMGFVGNEIFKADYKEKLDGLGSSEALLLTRKSEFEEHAATQVAMNEKALNDAKDLRASEQLGVSQHMEWDREDNAALDAIKDAVKDNKEQSVLMDEEESSQERSNMLENSLLGAC